MSAKLFFTLQDFKFPLFPLLTHSAMGIRKNEVLDECMSYLSDHAVPLPPDISPVPALRVLVDGESETEPSWELIQHVHQEAFIISEKKATSRSIVDRFLRSPLPSDKVGHLHDEGPADDSGDLELGAPKACLTQCHGEEQKEKKHWQFEHRWRHFQEAIADLQICGTGTGATG